MRTQILLLAALGVAGSATTMAQVYSVNAVGYVNVPLKPGYNLVANPLDNKEGNTVVKLLPAVDGIAVYKYVNGNYENTNAYSDLFAAWDNPDQTLAPGEGAFIFNPTAADITVTFVGEVIQGDTITTPLIAGFNMVSSKVPQAGKLQADLKYTPVDSDTVYRYINGTGYDNTADFSDLFGWSPEDPQVNVAQAFWLFKGAAGSWTRCFKVNTACP
jgi:hypothetical protein